MSNPKIYISGVPEDMATETFVELFKQFGEFADDQPYYRPATKTWMCFITYKDAASAAAAIEAMDGYQIEGNPKTLRVSEAREREERPRGAGFGGGNRGGGFNNRGGGYQGNRGGGFQDRGGNSGWDRAA